MRDIVILACTECKRRELQHDQEQAQDHRPVGVQEVLSLVPPPHVASGNEIADGVHRPVAQLVEHRSPKPGAGGSSPSWPASARDAHGERPVSAQRANEDRNVKSAMLERETPGAVRGVLGWWGRSRTFLAQVRNELERVTWPTWKEVQATTLVVILTSIMFGVYLWGIDLVLGRLSTVVFRTFGAS